MKIRFFILILLSFFFCTLSWSQAIDQSKVVQVTGVVLTSDSTEGVPYASIMVKNKERGTNANENGVFSFACFKGDTLIFSSVGYGKGTYVIPEETESKYINVIQVLKQDTFFLPETVIRPIPENFEYAFKYWDIVDDPYVIAQKNTNKTTMINLMYSLPKSGRENQSYYQRVQALDAGYYGQVKPMNVMNPLKWAEFIQAWKRGDFKKK